MQHSGSSFLVDVKPHEDCRSMRHSETGLQISGLDKKGLSQQGRGDGHRTKSLLMEHLREKHFGKNFTICCISVWELIGNINRAVH